MQSIGAKILAATKERHPNHHHPRLIMTEADFARLREKRGEGAYKPMLDTFICPKSIVGIIHSSISQSSAISS